MNRSESDYPTQYKEIQTVAKEAVKRTNAAKAIYDTLTEIIEGEYEVPSASRLVWAREAARQVLNDARETEDGLRRVYRSYVDSYGGDFNLGEGE